VSDSGAEDEGPRLVRCGDHGEAYETYVCRHLAADPLQAWFGGYPEEDNPWPDAWCAECNGVYLREGGQWSDAATDAIGIKLICSECYMDGRSRSVEHLGPEQRTRWDAYVAQCCAELDLKQERMIRELGLEEHERWDVDEGAGRLVFSNNGVAAVVAEIEVVGSLSSISDTWLWSWSNFSLPQPVRGRITKVREVGEREGFSHLTTPKWAATQHDAWHMTAVAARALGAIGAYRAPGEKVVTFLAIIAARRTD